MQAWTTYTTPDDFATDETFRAWVRAGQFMQPDHPATRWLEQHAHLIPVAQQAAEYIAATVVSEAPVAEADVQTVIDSTWESIRRQEAVNTARQIGQGRVVTPRWERPVSYWWAAAVLLLVGGLSWWLIRPQLTAPTEQALGTTAKPLAWIRETNRTRSAQLISLSDGSAVWLTPGSTLRHPVTFALDRREVELIGEAFFEVAKNARQPFFVRTQALTTRVVGTSFLVRAFDRNTQATVQVRTGRVIVYPSQPSGNATKKLRAITLRANEQVTVQATDSTLAAQPVSRPAELAQRLNQQTFAFTDAPVSTVLTMLAKTYGIEINYDAAQFRNCRITTTLSDEPLTEKLSILAEVIGPDTRYEVDGNQIRFSGKGCL